MEEPIFNPTIPYIGPIYGGKFVPGKMVKIQGSVPGNANRFNIHLQCGPKAAPRDDVAIRVSVRFVEGHLSLNSLQNTTWGREQRDLALPVKCGEKFKMILTCDASQYMVAINGQHCYEFPQRIPCDRITYLAIDGDILVSQISYDLPSDSGTDVAPKAPSSTPLPPPKNKSNKSQKKSNKKSSSAQVHTAPLPETESAIPRRLSYEAAIYGNEAAYGYQEVSIIPSGTPPRTKASYGSTRVGPGVSSYYSSPPKLDPIVTPYPTNGPKGMPFPTRSPTPTKARIASGAPPYSTNGAGGIPVLTSSPKSIKRPLDPPPAAPKSPSPPTNVSIPLITGSSDVQPVKDTECQMCWSNFFGVVVGALFVLFFVILHSV